MSASAYELTKDSQTFLLNAFILNNRNCMIIKDERIRRSLLNNKLIEANMNETGSCFKITEDGIRYCEQQIKINKKLKKDNFIQWCTLGLSALAILLSIISLSIQFFSYRNEKKEIKSENADISAEIIDNTTNIDSGIE